METGELACEIRTTRPKGQSNALRRQGRIPAVLYGPTTKATAVTVDRIELKARVSAAAHVRLIKLKSSTADLDGRHVIFKDVQRAPVSGEILHADLYEVDLNRPLRVEIAFKFVGKAKGLANGGILAPLERTATVECLPLEIPDAIEVDVTDVDIHDVIHISTVKFSGNVKPIFDTDYPVVTVLPPTVAEIAVPVAAEAVEGAVVEGAAAEAGAAPAAEAGAKEADDKGGKKPEAAKKK
ncbi:MAG: 50S ribosomal protein L25 [Candidatus Binatus sp.]|uniref:50S ribosomal protein L25 n=1 Tax=Candidatus Binatus sp. TaxID=2811406 RepID=UPI00271F9528|nr:50S ribosomal protein L25 [Candidatus Binatus sp.]MDO8431748.1 50S ribosomal protein L25 [Candidatus Binatus sp.]